MYNPYQAPGSYAPPGGYGGFTGAPGMGKPIYNHRKTTANITAPPPGMAAPGTGAPPGMQQAETPTDGRPTGFPPNFQPPANMPNINFSAPVIRLGTSQPAKSSLLDGRDDRGGRRAGLGSGTDQRGQDRGGLAPVQPQTREEIIKTIFIGGITEGCGGDEGIERILRAAGILKRWVRATDAQDKPCKFGFAEYDDPESLNTAIETLKDVRVPVKRQTPRESKHGENGDDAEEEIAKSTLLVVADENSRAYIDQYEESIGGVDEDSRRMRLDHARSTLEAVLNDLTYPSAAQPKDELSALDRDGDTDMANGVDANGETILTIPISADDELSDIPAEMRETVAKEIAAFRDRSNRRDLERLKREEEIEQQERNRMLNGNGRSSRLGSPPPSSAPSGPGGANGIPSGPRDRASGLNAPSGPKAYSGVQLPRDYAKGVTFVNGTGISTASTFDDTDTDASDSELERRRQSSKQAEEEKSYLDQERRWLNRERSRTAAVEREKTRDDEEAAKLDDEKEAMAKRLREFDDEKEANRASEEYYADHGAWMRKRSAFRERERMNDESDRAAERRERDRDNRQRDRAGRDADAFFSGVDRDREREDMDRSRDRERDRDRDRDRRRDDRRPSGSQHSPTSPTSSSAAAPPQQPARFKLSLGAAAQRQAVEKEKNKRTVAEVEGLLEDEEAETTTKRELVKIDFGPTSSAPTAPGETAAENMTPEQRTAAAKALAAEIPNDTEGLWNWDVKWEFVDEETVIEDRLRPFVEKKIVEYLGVQEQMLVDVVVNGLRERKGAKELVGELEGALDEEAEQLVKKLWRMVIFFSESEKRGLST